MIPQNHNQKQVYNMHKISVYIYIPEIAIIDQFPVDIDQVWVYNTLRD